MTFRRIILHTEYFVNEKDVESCIKRAKQLFNADMIYADLPSDRMQVNSFPMTQEAVKEEQK
jgi:2-methylisocitrate lyase-like PEP mutase family enzyme